MAEDVFVPVTNANYVPEGVTRFQGFVSPESGGIPEDKVIQQIKAQNEALGLKSGPVAEDEAPDSPEAQVEADQAGRHESPDQPA